MKRFFHSELESFRSHIILMGEKCVENVRLVTRGLFERDLNACREVLIRDDEIDELEKTIDAEAVRYVSLRGPLASDLRLLFIGMKAGQDLERVGDETSSIAKRSINLINDLPLEDYMNLPHMSELTITMLKDAVQCFLDEDADLAKELVIRDKKVDDINRQHFKDFSNLLMQHPERASAYLDLIFISKSLERIADHATNLAEEVYYLINAEDLRHLESLKKLKKQS